MQDPSRHHATASRHVQLCRPGSQTPWGFRLQGGRDFQQPITVQRITPGGIAEKSLCVGDQLLTISGIDTDTLTSIQSQDLVKSAGCVLPVYIYRAPSNGNQHQQSPGQQQYPAQSPLSPVHGAYSVQAPSQVPTHQGQLNCMFDDFFKQSDALFQRCLATDACPVDTPTTELIAVHSPKSTPATTPATTPASIPLRNPLMTSQQPGSKNMSPTSMMTMGSPISPPAPPPPPPSSQATPTFRLGRPPQQRRQVQQSDPGCQKAMPDAVINMASRQADSDRKPFAYVADAGQLNQHRDRVRRKPGAQPSYMNYISETTGSPIQGQPLKQHTPQQHTPQQQTPQQYAPQEYSPQHTQQHTPQQQYRNPALVRETTPEAPEGEKAKVVVHNLYNTPMGLYSNNNANSAMASQTGIAGESTGDKEKPDITQSATYRLIHGLDDNTNKPRQNRRPPAVKAKTFAHEGQPEGHQGQKQFSPEVQNGNLHPQYNSQGEVDEVSGYDETSIRYKGGSCPGNAFRMLQNMTEHPGKAVVQKKQHQHTPQHASQHHASSPAHSANQQYSQSPNHAHQHSGNAHTSPPIPHNYGSPNSASNNQHNYPQQSYLNQGNKHLRPVNASQPSKPEVNTIDDDIVDIKYVGAHIPSRSFRYLQKFVGDDTPPVAAQEEDKKCSVKVVHLRKKEEEFSGSTDF